MRPFAQPAATSVEPPGPDEEIVAGRRPVEEAFVARRQAFRLLVTPQRRAALERIVLHATSLRIPIVEVEGGSLTAVTGFDGHQGVALVVAARRYATLDDVLARAIERGEAPFVLALDSLEDPQNVGTLLRSAEAAGVHGVIFPTHRQAPLTPAAVKASAGAVEHLLLVPVDDLAGALTDLHVRGLRVAGADAEAPMTARDSDLRGPLVLVVGSEGQGLGPTVRRRCDLVVRIPMRGAIGSLNAAVAGSVLLFEAVAQRDPEGSATGPTAGSSTLGALAPAARPRRPTWDDPGDLPETVVDPVGAASPAAGALAAATDAGEAVALKRTSRAKAKPAPATVPTPTRQTARAKSKTTETKAVPVIAAEPAPATKRTARPKASARTAATEPGPAKLPALAKASAAAVVTEHAPAKPAARPKSKTSVTPKAAPVQAARRTKAAPAVAVSREVTTADDDLDLLPD